MSDESTAYDRDIEWLYRACDKRGIRPTEAQEETFAERVSIMIKEAGLSEATARQKAFNLEFGK